MKQILKYLKGHFQQDFEWAYYLSIAAFLALCISLNYYFDFEDSVIDSYYGQHIRILYFSLFYGFAYYGSSLIMAFYKGNLRIFTNVDFWIRSGLILVLLGLDGAFHYHDLLLKEFPGVIRYPTRSIIKNLINIFTLLLPLYVFYRWKDRQVNSFYGLTTKGFDYRPYAILLLIMVPLILAASFLENFNDFYPIYRPNRAHEYFGTPEWVPAIIYELAYGWNFLSIELAFRGFMILSLAPILGRNVVIPMVVTYCFYHFGKPEGEAISSVVGGYILGVIALESRSIFGGVMVHVGVAWLMELFAWLQKDLGG